MSVTDNPVGRQNQCSRFNVNIWYTGVHAYRFFYDWCWFIGWLQNIKNVIKAMILAPNSSFSRFTWFNDLCAPKSFQLWPSIINLQKIPAGDFKCAHIGTCFVWHMWTWRCLRHTLRFCFKSLWTGESKIFSIIKSFYKVVTTRRVSR